MYAEATSMTGTKMERDQAGKSEESRTGFEGLRDTLFTVLPLQKEKADTLGY